MKKLILLNLVMLLFASSTYSQMQKGDQSVGFQAFLYIYEGTTLGSILGTYSYNFSDKFKLTFGPQITITSSTTTTINRNTGQLEEESEVTASVGSSFLGEYYFSNKAKVSPFVLAGLYWPDFGESTKALVTGPGINYFISKNVSWKSNWQLGILFIPGMETVGTTTESESSTVFFTMFNTGLEFRF
jgi:hypothetical protein